MVTVYFDAHARSLDNEANRISGHFDVELSEDGRRQAAGEKAARYSEVELDMVFTSDLRRCVETVEIMFKDRAIPIVKDKRLRECDYGAYTGRPRSELLKIAGEMIDKPFPGGESYHQVLARFRSFLVDLVASHAGETVLLMDHGSVLWGLEHIVGGTPLREAMQMSPVENLAKKFLVTRQSLTQISPFGPVVPE